MRPGTQFLVRDGGLQNIFSVSRISNSDSKQKIKQGISEPFYRYVTFEDERFKKEDIKMLSQHSRVMILSEGDIFKFTEDEQRFQILWMRYQNPQTKMMMK